MAFESDSSSSSDSGSSGRSSDEGCASSSPGSEPPSLEAMSISDGSCVSDPEHRRGPGRPAGVYRTPLDNLGRRLSTSLRGYDPAMTHVGRTRSATGNVLLV